MKRSGRKQEWSLAMFAFGGLIFFPPLVGLFDKPVLVLGLPLSYLVMFGVWLVIIFGIWMGARRSPLRGELPLSGSDAPLQPTFDQASGSPLEHEAVRPTGQG